jgi:hypothetical protein
LNIEHRTPNIERRNKEERRVAALYERRSECDVEKSTIRRKIGWIDRPGRDVQSVKKIANDAKFVLIDDS